MSNQNQDNSQHHIIVAYQQVINGFITYHFAIALCNVVPWLWFSSCLAQPNCLSRLPLQQSQRSTVQYFRHGPDQSVWTTPLEEDIFERYGLDLDFCDDWHDDDDGWMDEDSSTTCRLVVEGLINDCDCDWWCGVNGWCWGNNLWNRDSKTFCRFSSKWIEDLVFLYITDRLTSLQHRKNVILLWYRS